MLDNAVRAMAKGESYLIKHEVMNIWTYTDGICKRTMAVMSAGTGGAAASSWVRQGTEMNGKRVCGLKF